MTGLNLTEKRVELLRLLVRKGEYCITSLADGIAQRKAGWTRQGAARWVGGYVVRPLERAGLVSVDRYVSAGVGLVSITEAGRLALDEIGELD